MQANTLAKKYEITGVQALDPIEGQVTAFAVSGEGVSGAIDNGMGSHVSCFSPHKGRVHTLTYDNGKDLAEHEQIVRQ